MRSAEPSALGPALRLALQGLRSRGGRAAAPPAPRRRVSVERRGIRVDPRRAATYLGVTRGGGVAALAGPQPALLSPAYPALWETALVVELLAQGGLPFPSAGMIHLASELVNLRPLEPGDSIRCRLEVERVEPDPRGARVSLVGRNWNAAGQLCVQSSMQLLLRERGADGRGRTRGLEAAESPPEEAWEELASWSLGGGHGRRYARVSGDYNPIHLWGWSARLFGFRRPILHGYCTQAMVAHALIERRLGGDPMALRRLQVSFRAPLSLPARVRLLVAGAEGGGRFRVMGEEGEKPFAEGSWVG